MENNSNERDKRNMEYLKEGTNMVYKDNNCKGEELKKNDIKEGDKKYDGDGISEYQKNDNEISGKHPNSKDYQDDLGKIPNNTNDECLAFKEKYYTDQNIIFDKLGDTREFGNFYELIHNRKQKIISYINKDLTQYQNPDLRRFHNSAHAYDVLLSYHIFYPYLYEDYLYFSSLELSNINQDLEDCLQSMNELLKFTSNAFVPYDEDAVSTCEILLYYEHMKLRDNNDAEEENIIVKRRNSVNRRNMCLRLKTTDSLVDESKGLRIENARFIFKKPEEINK